VCGHGSITRREGSDLHGVKEAFRTTRIGYPGEIITDLLNGIVGNVRQDITFARAANVNGNDCEITLEP
jgi:hypothetical protein